LLEKILKQGTKKRNKKVERNKQINERETDRQTERKVVFQLLHPDTGIRTTAVFFKSSFWLRQMWDWDRFLSQTSVFPLASVLCVSISFIHYQH